MGALYPFVGVFTRGLTTLEHVLDVGAKHASGLGVTESEMLDWRLAEDMYPLRWQALFLAQFAREWASRAADLPVEGGPQDSTSLAALRAAIGETKAFLEGLSSQRFQGRDDVAIKVNLGQIEPELPLAQWLHGFAVPNFYFHLTTAYAILRSRGAPLGKVDFFAGGL